LLQRKSVPSTHMRWRMTAILLASATVARRMDVSSLGKWRYFVRVLGRYSSSSDLRALRGIA
jgi:hypothetical protein